MLVLEGVCELMRQDRLLLVDTHPVQHVDSLGFGVIVGCDLLIEEGEQEGLEGEIVVEEAEFLEDDFTLLEAFGSLIFVEFLFQISFDHGAGGELTLDR